jgi:hypothetical protein
MPQDDPISLILAMFEEVSKLFATVQGGDRSESNARLADLRTRLLAFAPPPVVTETSTDATTPNP